MKLLRIGGLALLLAAAACSSGSSGSSSSSHSTSSSGSGGNGGGGGGATCLPAQDDSPALLGADCDVLVPTQCGFPFPSNVFLADDATTKTGKRVKFGAKSLPVYTGNRVNMDAGVFSDSDGFSPGQSAITHLPGATVTGLPDQDHLDLSVTKDSPTILMEADTGALVPHFAELDESLYTEADDSRTFIIRPVIRLKDATRYIVAIRKVVDKDGKALAPTPAFKALRDKEDSCEVSVTRRRDLYEDIFSKLEKAGIDRKDLQLSWDYSTASRENNTARFLHMRDDALAQVGTDGPPYVIDTVEENPNQYIRRRINGHMTVPLYLDSPDPGGKFVLDASGLPTQQGTADFTFLVHIPNSATKGTPAPILQNGHGLLGAKTEGQDGYLAQICNDYNYVGVAVDLIGMAHEDAIPITGAIQSDVAGFKAEVDRQHQGILNSLLAMRLLRGKFASDPQTIIDGNKTIDPTQSFYRGDSQGGIFGTTYMAVSTDVTRGLLGEPGAPYNLLLNRSQDFNLYFLVLTASFDGGRNIQMVLGLLQMLWDRSEPDGYVPYINQNMLPGTPQHQVLLHAAIGDHQVTPLGAHLIARTIGAKNLSPVNRTLFGLPEDPGPFMGSGIVEFNFNLPAYPETNIPPPDDGLDPHDKVRVLKTAQDQEDHFFKTGEIKAYCQGPCMGQ